jgi:hypothetical protein
MVKEIQLTRGFVALVDDEDFERVSKFKWHASDSGSNCYAVRFDYAAVPHKKVKIYLHRFILGISEPFVLADHVDGNTLDCQKQNLRRATREQNAWNCQKSRTGMHRYKGVAKIGNSWMGQIGHIPGSRYLGCFRTEEEAAKAYDIAAKERFGEFARLNFPDTAEAA